jgi:retron-type reverse transcriptase
MPPGVTADPADGMGLASSQASMARRRYERYRWSPVRRIAIAKQRPPGLPAWADTRLQGVSRRLLEAHDAPPLSAHGQGFRPGRGCHTALTEMRRTWAGLVWCSGGDRARCCDRLDHGVLRSMLREQIQARRFVRSSEHLLKAGDLEHWVDHATPSGAPQGGVVSPIRSTIA